MYEYITFERQYGSGGQEIATRLSERLGYELYDRGVLVETCKRMNMDYSYISELDETAPSKLFFRAPGSSNLSLEEQIFNTETQIITEAAEKTGCIFVGRCASEILRDKKVLRVFVTASEDYRIKRAVDVEKVPQAKVYDQMKAVDKRRQRFFESHAGDNWKSADYFDIIINSGRLGIDKAVEMLEQVIKF